MRIRVALDNICQIIAKITSWITTACLTGSILVMLMQVILRRAFNRPIIWAEDLTVFIFIWITFLGAAVLYQRKQMTSVDSLIVFFPKKIRRIASIFVDGVVVAISAYLVKITLDYMQNQMRLGHKLGGALGIPIWVVLLCIIISMIMIVLFGCASIIKTFSEKNIEEPSATEQKENDA